MSINSVGFQFRAMRSPAATPLTRTVLFGVLFCTTVASPTAFGDEPTFVERPLAEICINTEGYLPKSAKLATVIGLGRDAEFVIRDVHSKQEVFRGQLKPCGAEADRDTTSTADFSPVIEEGTYVLTVAGHDSPQFHVARDVLNRPFYASVLAMNLWRCGSEVHREIGGETFNHPACHLDDAYLDFAGDAAAKKDAKRDGCGGWHDAGDYNKYTGNGAFTAGMMLAAWEHFPDRLKTLKLDIPESKNAIPDYLDEVRWELEWLLKMQADDGRAYHKLSTLQFGAFLAPEKETAKRYFSPWSSAATADLAAVMAQAARIYRPYDQAFADRCLAAAKNSYDFLKSHPEDHQADLSAFNTGPYNSRDRDDRLWAAAELWETTGDDAYLDDLQQRIATLIEKSQLGQPIVDLNWDWGDVRNLGLFTLALSKRPGGGELADRVRKDVIRVADTIVDTANEHPYGRPLGSRYYWGCNGTVVRLAMNLHVAEALTADEKYRGAMLDGINHVFGRNVHGCSYVTGLGHNPPMFPHDRRSGGDNVRAPWPGYLVGGPWPKPENWHDEQDDYRTNEIAINWNGALIYALAAFVEPESFAASVKTATNKSKESN